MKLIMNRSVAAAITLVMIAAYSSQDTSACKCRCGGDEGIGTRTYREAIEDYDVVLKGRVVRTESVDIKEKYIDDTNSTYEAVLAYVEVERARKGVDKRQVVVISRGGCCYVDFHTDGYVLIFANRLDDGTLESGLCSPSFEITLKTDSFDYLLGEPAVVFE